MPHKDPEVKRAYMRAYRKEYDQRDYVKQVNTEKRKRYYQENRDKELARMKRCFLKTVSQRERQLLIKVKVLSHYSNPPELSICNNCGEQDIEVLCLDHLEGGGNRHRRSMGSGYYDWIIKNDYPLGYQVLCYNCNIRKRRFDHVKTGN